MAIRYYDEALVNKIKKWIKDPNMTVLKPNESTQFFRLKADINNDKPLQLPLIAISRDSEVTIDNVSKRPLTFDGMMLDADNKKTTRQLMAIPISIGYQIDIYTRYEDEGDEYLRNFIFSLINHPKLEIMIPYNNLNYIHESNITLESTVEDNSDIDEHLFSDQFTRWTISLTIDDAYLFSAPISDNLEMQAELEIKED